MQKEKKTNLFILFLFLLKDFSSAKFSSFQEKMVRKGKTEDQYLFLSAFILSGLFIFMSHLALTLFSSKFLCFKSPRDFSSFLAFRVTRYNKRQFLKADNLLIFNNY